MEINQGDVFWYDAGDPRGSAPAFVRPVVVIQNDTFNSSPLGTVLACVLTTNLRRAKAPGNVLLNENEADLSRQSVVVVSQVLTIDKSELLERIGTVPKNRIDEIVSGIKLLIEPIGNDDEE
ncbi:MAG: type II toxin-antitoxin system PemK/MazF family toxin [Acidobacteria bacterium]|nr:type II toxin-antitoxin system PemK/MazF family toxin [Acidobacteriota bacterium]